MINIFKRKENEKKLNDSVDALVMSQIEDSDRRMETINFIVKRIEEGSFNSVTIQRMSQNIVDRLIINKKASKEAVMLTEVLLYDLVRNLKEYELNQMEKKKNEN